ncbi:MAG: amino acid adenylation domain-containing protein [Halanaerobiales bacterium]|nr:amino acid adenylation domain-containing protein [Halanaerobiales bacterium]
MHKDLGIDNNFYQEKDIAVIGMSGRFPEANNLDEFWNNLIAGKDSIREFPESRWAELKAIFGMDITETVKGGYIDNITLFEPEIFLISQEESKYIDPQQRLLLELVEEAFLDAGYNPEKLSGRNIGVFVAEAENWYSRSNASFSPMAFTNRLSVAGVGRVAYTYNFYGPAYVVGTACSSSLVALNNACQSILLDESEMALVGGVNISLIPTQLKNLEHLPITSKDQKAKTFDKEANGTIGGEGGGVVLLKPLKKALEDRDNIHAIIKGCAVNSDGNRSNGMSAPSEDGQAEVILKAFEVAGIDPLSLSYLEAHGTGTKIGDPIEIAGISNALNKLGYLKHSVPIGSLKTNIGHLDGAAGIANVIKAILAIKNKKLPPSINFNEPNPLIDFVDSPVYVNDTLRIFDAKFPLTVGVTSLGLIGTNSHALIQEYIDNRSEEVESGKEVVVLSARTQASLQGIIDRLKDYLKRNRDLSLKNIVYTLNTGRRDLKYKYATVVGSVEELITNLQNYSPEIEDGDNWITYQRNRNKLSSKLGLMVLDFADVDDTIFTDLYANDYNYRRVYDQSLADVAEDDVHNPKVQYLLHLHAYTTLYEKYLGKPKAILGFGMGNIIANFLSKKVSLQDTIKLLKKYDKAKIDIPEDKLSGFIDMVIAKGINTFAIVAPGVKLQELFSRLLDKKSEANLIVLDEKRDRLFNKVLELLKDGLEINWNRFYQAEDRKKVSLSGYVFDRKSYYLEGNTNFGISNSEDPENKFDQEEAYNLLYQLEWEEAITEGDSICEDQKNIWLIFYDELGIGREIKTELEFLDQIIIEVRMGTEFEKISSTCYKVSGEEADYHKLIREVKTEGLELAGVINLYNCHLPAAQYTFRQHDEVEKNLYRGLMNGVYLYKSLTDSFAKLKIYNITTNAHRVLTKDSLVMPESRLIWALNKVINQEMENYQAFVLDIDLKNVEKEELARQIIKEIMTNSGEILEIAFRNNKRYIQQLVQIKNICIQKSLLPLKEGGLYLVSGGTGGIALEICKDLVQKRKIKLVLLDVNPLNSIENYKREIVDFIKDKVESFDYYQVDISNYHEMETVIDEIKAKYDCINGVIHTAGLMHPITPLTEFDSAGFAQIIAPKVAGTMILEELLRDQFLDFFVDFSSLNSVLGGSGLAYYVCANAFLDGFSVMQRQLGKRFNTVNWGGWVQTGMGRIDLPSVSNIGQGFMQIQREEGLLGFEALIRYNLDNVWVCRLSDKVKNFLKEIRFFKIGDFTEYTPVAQTVLMSGNIRENLSTIFNEIYVGEEFSYEDQINELAFDSIDIMHFVGKIKKCYNVEVSVKLFFEPISTEELFTTIERLIDKGTRESSIRKQPEQDYYPVSSAQHRLFVLNQFDIENIGYNMNGALVIEGRLDKEAFEQTFRALINRHEALRTSFNLNDGKPVQIIKKEIEFAIDYFDQDHLEALGGDIAKIVEEFIRPFDLTVAPLMRVGLLDLGSEKYLFLFDMHHIISDGVSMGIFISDFIDLYQGKTLKSVDIQYKDFSIWQNELFASEKIKMQEEFWLDKFTGEIPILNLPTDYPRPLVMDFAGDGVLCTLNEELTSAIKGLMQNTNTTLYMVLLAIYNVLLAKYTGQDDIIVGLPSSGRNHADVEQIMGMFVNTLAMRNFPKKDKTFSEFLYEVKENALKAYDNQDYQFEMLVEKLDLQRDASRNPLFDTMLALQNTRMPEILIPGLKFVPYERKKKTTNFDLLLDAAEKDDKINLSMEYRVKLFKRETIERLAQHFERIVTEVTQNLEIKIGDIEIISENEKEELLYNLNASCQEYPSEVTIHQLIEEQVDQTPNNQALVYNGQELTYSQLNVHANQLARHLRQKGVGRDQFVGIMVKPSREMMVGILGILKAGGAYLPIDPDYPEERIEYMLQDSGTRILLTQSELSGKVEFDGEVIALEENGIYQGECHNLENINTATDLAYVIYTSGSTGQPKGVMIEHKSLVNLAYWHVRTYQVTEADNATKYAGFGFDASVWEIFPYMITGATIHIIDEELKLDMERLNGYFEQNQVTISFLPTQICEQFMNHDNKSLRILLTGGDKLKKFIKRDYQLYNNYGPTENTVVSTYCLITETHHNIPIGKPVDNTRIYILDEKNQLQPIGVTGELCISGVGLARGYLNQPELTQEKFVADPFFPDAKMYRTGDLARWTVDGNIEFLGRIDYQVKIRGYRIELGEIENQLLKHPEIREVIVIDRQSANGEKYLACYYISSEELSKEELRDYLAINLPEYMIPTSFTKLEQLPLTANGKLDRKALPETEEMQQTCYTAPRNSTEEIVSRIWTELLGSKQVGIYDNFFELGGDSIKAIQIVSRTKGHGINIMVKDIFRYKNIASLLENVDYHEEALQISQEVVTGEVSLTPIQSWFFDQQFVEPQYFNQTYIARLQNDVDLNLLEEAFRKLIEHHDALRIKYSRVEEKVIQYNRGIDEVSFKLEHVNLVNYSAEEQKQKLKEFSEAIQQKLDLEKDLLIKAIVFDLGENGKRLVIPVHHLVIDGVSWRIFFEDLQSLYISRLDKPLPLKTTSFKEWSEKLTQYAKEYELDLDYWEKIKLDRVTSLVTDQVDNYLRDHKSLQIQLTEDETEKLLTKVSWVYNTEINDLLLSALTLAIEQALGINNILINLEGHGREEIFKDVDLSRTIGWFTTTYPVYFESKDGIGETIKHVKESLRRVPAKGLNFSITRYLQNNQRLKELNPEISFNYLGQFSNTTDLEDISVLMSCTDDPGMSFHRDNKHPYLIDFNGMISDGKLQFNLSYNAKYLEDGKIEELQRVFHQNLLAIINHCLTKSKRIFTPSDFGLEKYITQKDFAQIESKIDLSQAKIYPLTPMQEGMLFYNMLNSDGDNYYEQICFYIDGDLDIAKMEEAFREVVNRHEALRINTFWKGLSKPVQIIRPKSEIGITYLDKSGASDYLTELIEDFKIKDLANKFDFENGELTRMTLIKVSTQKYFVAWTFHHLLLDGWSVQIVLRDLLLIYNDLLNQRELLGLPLAQFSNYLEWLKDKEVKMGVRFWRNYLKDFEEPTFLPYDKKVSNDQVITTLAKREYLYDSETTARINQFCKTASITPNAFIQTIWGLLLQKYNNTEISCFGSTVSGRPADLPDVESIVGIFINTLPIIVKRTTEDNLLDLLRRVNDELVELRDWEYFPLVDIQKINNYTDQLFDSLLVFENYPTSAVDQSQYPDFQIKFDSAFELTNYNLSITVIFDHTLLFRFGYNPAVFREETIAKIESHLIELIDFVLTNPEAKIKEVSIVTDEEKEKLLFKFNETDSSYPKEKTIQQLFEEQVSRHPDKVALVLGEDQLTYRQLNERANQLARVLRAKGVGANQIVGMIIERSLEMIVGIMAIFKAGGAYLPIDPEYPESRIRFMLEDTHTQLLLTQKHLLDQIEFSGEILDLTDTELYQGDGSNLECVNNSANLAYVIFTSGTTGKPKGNLTSHYSIVRVVKNTNYIEITPEDKLLQLSNYAFDGSTFDIYGALLNGATLVMVLKETILNLIKLSEVIKKEEVSVFFVTTALFNTLVDLDIQALTKVRKILFGGERVSVVHVQKALKVLGLGRLIHVYGPTESTVFATYYFIDHFTEDTENVPIGSPLANTQIYILDKDDNLQAIGLPGEIYIGGDGLVSGYLNRPELTEVKFVENPFMPGKKMYRTGDLARWLPDGNVEFLGRIDHQVKIRGFRIEPGEVENQILIHSDIREVIVTVETDSTGGKYLCAYYVARKELLAAELKEYLLQELPAYMIPAVFMQLEKLPLTLNGKIDRKALPKPELHIVGGEYMAPEDELQEKLVAIWEDILGLEQVGIDDNFFEIGGHSLKATTFISELYKEHNIELPLNEVFKRPTIRELSQVIREQAAFSFAGKDPNLVLLSRGTTQDKHLFMIHAGNGEIEVYMKLANKLYPEFNYWGIKSDRFENLAPQNIKIEDLAKYYAEKIKRLQPKGPYYLFGWCIGGSIAFEVANCLEKENEEVKLLALINSSGPDKSLYEQVSPFTLESELGLVRHIFNDDQLLSRLKEVKEIEEVWPIVVNYMLETNFEINNLKQDAIFQRDFAKTIPNFETANTTEVIYYFNVIRSYFTTRGLYTPSKKLDADIHYFEANKTKLPTKGNWNNYTTNDFTVYDIQGDHHSIFDEPDLNELAGILNNLLWNNQ